MHPRVRAMTEEHERYKIACARTSAYYIDASLRQSDIVGVIARDMYNIRANERCTLLLGGSSLINLLKI